MAAAMTCDGPDDEQAVIILTLLADGDTSALCGSCLLDWCQGILQAAAPDRLAAPPEAQPRPRKPRPVKAAAIAASEQGASVTELDSKRGGAANADSSSTS